MSQLSKEELFEEFLNPESQSVNYKRFAFILLNKWKWIIGGVFIGVIVAFVLMKMKGQDYQADTSILIPETNSSLDLENIFKNTLSGTMKSSAISNEILLLKSYTLSHRAIENLNWRTIWFERDWLKWKGIYQKEPFIVQEYKERDNLEGILVYISPIDQNKYEISVHGDFKKNGKVIKVDFSSTGQFGEPFQNRYFDFTLHKKNDSEVIVGNEYRFSFSNYNNLTFRYLNRLKILQQVKDGDVISLSLEGDEPLRDIHYLNELVKVYMDLKLEVATQTKERSLKFIDKQLSGISDSLHIAGSNFTQFRAKNQIIDLGAQGEIVMQQLNDLEKQRSQQQMQLDYFENLLKYLGKSEGIQQMVTPSVVGVEDPGLNNLVVDLSKLYSQREVLAFTAKENNPRLLLLNKEISQTTSQLKQNLLNLIDNAKLSIRNLQSQYTKINQQLNHLPQKEQELINIKRQYELTNEIYTFLLQKRSETEIALASATVNVQIVDPAQLERIFPTGLSNKLFLIIGFILGGGLPIFFILGFDQLSNRIQIQDDVEKHTSLPVMGNVFHNRIKSELGVYSDPTSPLAESFRGIRTNLQYKLMEKGCQVIAVHSLRPGEGKSFIASNLATILSMNDAKTVLIGADMRKPRLHRVFQQKNKSIGLSSYLIGKYNYETIVSSTAIPNLYLVSSGDVPPNPAELLGRKRFGELIEQLKNDFDYIVIDNAPVSMVTDGQLTARSADVNLFVLRYGVSTREEVQFINNLEEKNIIQDIAYVINDVKVTRFSSNYGYGYGYGYGYKYRYGHKSSKNIFSHLFGTNQ